MVGYLYPHKKNRLHNISTGELMPDADLEKKREGNREYYLKNKEYYKKYYIKNKDHVDAYHRKYNKDLRDKKIQWLKEFLGSSEIWCDRCKYRTCFEAIHMHHLDKKQKKTARDTLAYWLGVGANMSVFQDKILETDFLLLCANCHAELHAGVWEWPMY